MIAVIHSATTFILLPFLMSSIVVAISVVQYPVSGVFTSDQRAIYETVLNAQIAVMTMLRPGVSWVDCHLAAEREVVSGLLAVGVLTSGTVEEIIEAEVGAVFFPHGLGHLIGCDTHDVGG